MADRQTIGKLRLPLPPIRKVNWHEALDPGHTLRYRSAACVWPQFSIQPGGTAKQP